MKFRKVVLHAFRAYKDKEFGTFNFTLKDGSIANFISIYAPNGFGKTSFYDGVEWGMTNNIRRFKKLSDDAKAEKNNHEDKQFILQNENISISQDRGYIQVETTIPKYSSKKDIKVISTSSTSDFVFNKRKIENKFFQDVLLSQDGIDNFLKADNNEERYDKFFSSLGDKKLDKYHKNIVKLENKNNQDAKDINKNIASINEELKVKIDEKIFDFSNQKIEELNKSGSKYSLIDDSFNETKKIEFESKLNEQKLKVNNRIEDNKSLKEKLPQWTEDSTNYFKDKQVRNESKIKMKDYEELKSCNVGIELLNQEHIKQNNSKSELEKLEKDYPRYITIKEEIKKNEKSLQEEHRKVIEIEIEKDKSINAFENLEKDVISVEKKKTELDTFILEIPQHYKNIKTFTTYMEESQKNLDENSVIKVSIDSLEGNKSKLISTKEAIKNNVFLDISSDELYKSKVLDIEEKLKETDRLNTKLEQVQKEEKESKKYNSELKRLLSIGMNMVDEISSDTCPLCNTKQESYNILKGKILDNPFLDKLEKELLEKKDSILDSIRINSKKIEDDKNLILSDYNKKIADIESEIIELKHKEKKIDIEKLEQYRESKEQLLSKTENKSEEEFLRLKVQEQDDTNTLLETLYKDKKSIDEFKSTAISKFELLNNSIESIKKNINEFKSKEVYTKIIEWSSTLKNSNDILGQLTNIITNIDKLLDTNREELIKLNKNKELLEKKLELLDIENLDTIIEKLQNNISELNTKIITLESLYEQYFSSKIDNKDAVQKDISKKHIELKDKLKSDGDIVVLISSLEENIDALLKFIKNKQKKKELKELESDLELKKKVSQKLKEELEKVERKIENDVKAFFQEDLINQIYEKIDPHPEYKRVKFECSFEKGIGKLNIFVNDKDNNKHISPSLYYSTAQLNVLSLSIFLAKALCVQDDEGNSVDCIFIDDPIQSMDSINILSTIDLLRSLVVNHGKQIILSTHDENFYQLLQKKIPTEYFDSKFIELETFGKVKVQK